MGLHCFFYFHDGSSGGAAISLVPTVRTWPGLEINEFFPTDDFAKSLRNFIREDDLTTLDFSGLEQLTDEVFFVLQHEKIAQNLKEVICTGCVHITDFGVHLLVQGCPNLEQVTLDGCCKVGTQSLQKLICGCLNLRMVSLRATRVSHVPAAVPPQLAIHLEGCPLLHLDPGKEKYKESNSYVAKLQRQKLVILAKEEVATSVLGFLIDGTFEQSAAHCRTYKKDVVIPNVACASFNIFECHSTRTSYVPFMSDEAAYVFAFDVKFVSETVLQHVVTMLNSIRGQSQHAPVILLGLHTGETAEKDLLSQLGAQIDNCLRQHTSLLEGHLDNEAYFNDKLEERDFLTQIRQMRGREHFSTRSLYFLLTVNTLTSETMLVWPKYLVSDEDESERLASGAQNSKESERGESMTRETRLKLAKKTLKEKEETQRDQSVSLINQLDTGLQEEDIVKALESTREKAAKLLETISSDWMNVQDELNRITKADVSSVKSFSKPPQILIDVMGCMVILLGHSDSSWNEIKRVLSDATFISKLKNFDKDSIAPKAMNFVKPYFESGDITSQKVRNVSTLGSGIWRWVQAVYSYGLISPQLQECKHQLRKLENQRDRIQKTEGLFCVGPNLIQGLLKKAVLKLRESFYEDGRFCSEYVSAVLTTVQGLTDQRLVLLEDVIKAVQETSGVDNTSYSPASAKEALQKLHIMGQVLFYPDVPDHLVVTDIQWFMSIVQGIESLNDVEATWNQGRVMGLGPDEAVFTQSQFIRLRNPDASDEQVERVFAILHELGTLVSIPVQQMVETESDEQHFFLFSCLKEKIWLARSPSDGLRTTLKFDQVYWPEQPGPETLRVQYHYKFNYGMSLSLLPRVVDECLLMGTVLQIWKWGVIVRQGAAEIRIQHNIQAIQRSSSFDLELRMMSVTPVHILQQYVWSILSNYLLIIDYQAHRFPHLAVKPRLQCRGQCRNLGFPHMFGVPELRTALGYSPHCPKCMEMSMTSENTGYLIGRQHFLPFHTYVDVHGSASCRNPHSQYSRLGDVGHLRQIATAQWKCLVCGVTGRKISKMETSLYPSFVTSILGQAQSTDRQKPYIDQQGNILQLAVPVSESPQPQSDSAHDSASVGFSHHLMLNGLTELSVTILSPGTIVFLLSKDTDFDRYGGVTDPLSSDVNLWFDMGSGHMYRLDMSVSGMETLTAVESQSTFGVGDTVTVQAIRQREKRKVNIVVTEVKLLKNGVEFACVDVPFRNYPGILLRRDGQGCLPRVILNCPSYPVVRAHHFQLGSALLYMCSTTKHWTLGKILTVQNGLLTIGDDVDCLEAETFRADSDLIAPLNINQETITIYIGKEMKRDQEQVAEWLLSHQSWPALPALFSVYHKDKSQIVYRNIRKLGLSTTACTTNPHSPQVLHRSMTQHHSSAGKENSYTAARNCVLLPQHLDIQNVMNPHREMVHQWGSQSAHLVCTAQPLKGLGESEHTSDAHFLGVEPVSVEPTKIPFFQTAYLDAVISTYHSFLNLTNFFVPFGEGLDDVPLVERGIRHMMEVYLATFVLFKRLNMPFLVPMAKDKTASEYILSLKKKLQEKLKDTAYGNMCATHKALVKNNIFTKETFPTKVFTYGHNIHYLSAARAPKLEVLGQLCKTFPHLEVLNLSDCKLSQLEGISSCSQLTSLNLKSNNFNSIPEELTALTSTLASLNMVDNPLTNLPDFITKFTNLTELHLSGVKELPEDFGGLRKLRVLRFFDSTLSQLPASFESLHRLEVLHLKGIPWPSIPLGKDYTESVFDAWLGKQSPVVDKDAMKALFVTHNTNQDKILKADDIQGFLQALSDAFPRFGQNGVNSQTGGIPPQVFKCHHLHNLNIVYQAITSVPHAIEQLKQMVVLDVGKNLALETISGSVGKLTRLKYLKVASWPNLRTPPPEIVAQGNTSLIGYLRRLSQGSVACFRTKLMFVGLGGAGKTSLMRALMSKDGQSRSTVGEGITDGIDISTWTINTVNHNVTFSVWDFAGQTIYYNTHQFFLSKRAVYMLVWNTRLGYEHSGLDFWLSSIACHTPKTPIFVVGTHADQITKSDIPAQKLKDRFPNIVGFISVSSHTGKGIEALKGQLMKVTLEQPYIGEQVPEAWLHLEKGILGERSHQSVLRWKEVSTLGKKCGLIGPELRRAVLFLHELGTLQYFDSELLRDRVVINPQWIVDVMTCVVSVHNTIVENGHLAHDQISVIWKDYPAELHEWLLHLTEVFDLTFPLADRRENVVPCLLPQSEPTYEWMETGGENIEMMINYRFDYLPAGLFNRAQVRLYQFSDSSVMWKSGSVLRKNRHMAVVKQTSDTTVLVRIIGPKPENMMLLVHEVFEGLISDFFQGVKYEYQLPCIDCIRSETIKDPWMFSSRMMTRAVQMKALFLQCHCFFHTLSISDVQAVMPPTSNTDYALQLESAIQELDGLEQDLTSDVFFVYCDRDVPSNVKSSQGIHPTRIKNDLAKAGITSRLEDKLTTKKVEDIAIAMKNSKVVLVLISDDFVLDEHCQRLFTFVHDIMRKDILLLMVGQGRQWQQSEIGMQVADKVFLNFQRIKQYDMKMECLTEQLTQKLGKRKPKEESSCDVFLSYCWSNSEMSIGEGLARIKEGSVGAGDPRKIKSFLEESGLQVWLDLEKTGKTGLFSDIAEGMKRAKVVVACVSDEYVLSRNCQMEFRFAHIALHLPLVLAVVGTGFQWESTEIGMLSLGYPKVNFQVANNVAHRQLLEHVQEIVSRSKIIDDVERPFTPLDTSQKEMAFLELYEMAQRKFLRQISSYLEPTANYPRLFVVDLNYRTSSPSSQEAKDVDVAELDLGVETEDSSDNSSTIDLSSGMFCIKTLCEHEGGWHAVTEGVAIDLTGPDLMLLWQLTAPYMARILAILKHSSINLHIITQPEGLKVMKTLEQKAVIEPQFDLRPLYLRLRQYVNMKDTEKTKGGLSRCYLPSGKVLWLCEQHQQQPRITVLNSTDEDSDLSELLSENEVPEAWLLAGLTEVVGSASQQDGLETSPCDKKTPSGAVTSKKISQPPTVTPASQKTAKGKDKTKPTAHGRAARTRRTHRARSSGSQETEQRAGREGQMASSEEQMASPEEQMASPEEQMAHQEAHRIVAGEIAAATKRVEKSQACNIL